VAAKTEFAMANEGVTNFSYFLTEAAYSGRVITPRQVLVIDECHNAEEALSRFVEVTVSERFARSILKLDMPVFKTEVQAFNWVRDVYSPKLISHVKHIETIMAKFASIKDKLTEMLKYTQQLDMLQKHKGKIEKFITLWDPDNWAVNFVDAFDRAERKIEFKPVDVATFTADNLFKFGEKIVMMSATVINHEAFCASLGVPLDNVGFISIPTPFPPENRPVFFVPTGRMTMNELDKTIPSMCKVIKGLLDQHKNEKGIIHTHSYKIAKAIVATLNDKRLLIHDSFNRDEILKQHMNSSKPTVIVSPSSTEGLDLFDDNSRFQIICKIPYPYLGDKLVKKRMARNRKWYPYQTAKTIVQSLGRSIRNIDDHAVSYILDSDWEMFLSRNPEMFNKSFTDSLI
jgi:Rad3-related DNA helicase